MPSIGPMELVIVAAIALLILGPKRLPAAARSVGQGLREFKSSVAGASPAPREIDAETADAEGRA